MQWLATRHRRVKIDDLEIFYREAGDPQAPTLLLLHGFPSSSHMFRQLIPALAERWHVVAPDYAGFGFSGFPDRDAYDYSFAACAETMAKFTDAIGLARCRAASARGRAFRARDARPRDREPDPSVPR